MSIAPPPGFYVPAVLFFDENEDLDIPSIQSHVLRLAQVRYYLLINWVKSTYVCIALQGGVTGILVQGSNGEAQHLYSRMLYAEKYFL